MKTTLTIISVILLIAGTVKAQLVMYIPTSLPSSQGLIYTYDPSTANPAESDIFSIAGSTLWQNSMGIGNIAVNYRNYPAIDPSLSYYIDLQARVLQVDKPSYPYGFCFGAQVGDNRYVFGITPAAIYYHNGTSPQLIASVDNTLFHNYHVNLIPGGGWQFFVDGNLKRSGASSWNYPYTQEIFLGDGTKGCNAEAVIKSYEFGVVPEPSTILLLGSGLIGLGLLAKYRKKKS